MFSRTHINIFVIGFLSLAIPAYLKAKNYLLGNISIEQIFSPMIVYDVGLGFGLALVAVMTHELVIYQLRKFFPSRKQHLKRFLIQFSVSSISSSIAVYGFSLFFYAFFVPYYSPPKDFFLDVLILGLLIPIFINGIKESLFYYGEWENELLRKEQLEKENIQAQYEILKNQINPHFLFNCFNTLTELAHENKQQTILFIQQLSHVYRFVLENKDSELVELSNELNILDSYIYLLKIRFGDNVRINMENEKIKEFGHYNIVPMTLQILLENALKHNIATQDKPLTIDIEVENNDTLVFKNNLQQKSTLHSTKTGLQNIMNRYRLLADTTIDIIETTSEFIVRIPLISAQTT